MALHNAPNGPFVIQANNANSEVLRQMLESVTGAISGIINSGDFLVAAHGTPNMSVDVAAGFAIINGTEAAAQGSYQAFNDATVNVAITASNASNPRIDLVVVAVQDAQYSGASNQAVLAVIAGTPAGSPVVPTIPVSPYFNALALAQVAVGANVPFITSGNVTDVRSKLTTARGTLGYAGQSGPQGGFGFGSVAVTSCSTTVTVGTGRRVRLTGYASAFPTTHVANGGAIFTIWEGATQLALAEGTFIANHSAESFVASTILTPTAGSHTYGLFATTFGSGEVMTVGGDFNGNNNNAYILAEDIGI